MKLGLTRGDFNIFAEQTLKSLLQEADFSDVTLVCEDGALIRAHKVVLSSGSEFFRRLLLKNEHPCPLIYLRLAAHHLHALVGFIYTGECHVEQTVQYYINIIQNIMYKYYTNFIQESAMWSKATLRTFLGLLGISK